MNKTILTFSSICLLKFSAPILARVFYTSTITQEKVQKKPLSKISDERSTGVTSEDDVRKEEIREVVESQNPFPQVYSSAKVFQMCSQFLSQWKNYLKPQNLVIKKLTGMTNIVLHLKHVIPNVEPQQVILRIFGIAGQVIHMDKERAMFNALSESGIGPKNYGETDEFRVEEFIPSKSLTYLDLRSLEIISLFGAKICSFHHNELAMKTLLQFGKHTFIDQYFKEWLPIFKRDFPKYKARTQLKRNQEILSNMEIILSEEFDKEVSKLLALLPNPDAIVVGHNDIQELNLLHRVEEKELFLIDFSIFL